MDRLISILRPHSSILLPIGFFAALAALGCYYRVFDDASVTPSSAQEALETRDAILARPSSICLGSLQPGQLGKATVVFQNVSHRPVTVVSFESTCPCVRIAPLPLTLAPGESAVGAITYDPSHDPDFHGQLQVEIVGRQDDGTALCHASVVLSVATGI